MATARDAPPGGPAFEVDRFLARPVSDGAVLLELHGRFRETQAPPTPRLVVRSPGGRARTIPALESGADGEDWQASFALPREHLGGARFTLDAGRRVLLDLPSPDEEAELPAEPVGPGPGAVPSAAEHARLAREINALRRRVEAEQRAADDARAEVDAAIARAVEAETRATEAEGRASRGVGAEARVAEAEAELRRSRERGDQARSERDEARNAGDAALRERDAARQELAAARHEAAAALQERDAARGETTMARNDAAAVREELSAAQADVRAARRAQQRARAEVEALRRRGGGEPADEALDTTLSDVTDPDVITDEATVSAPAPDGEADTDEQPAGPVLGPRILRIPDEPGLDDETAPITALDLRSDAPPPRAVRPPVGRSVGEPAQIGARYIEPGETPNRGLPPIAAIAALVIVLLALIVLVLGVRPI